MLCHRISDISYFLSFPKGNESSSHIFKCGSEYTDKVGIEIKETNLTSTKAYSLSMIMRRPLSSPSLVVSNKLERGIFQRRQEAEISTHCSFVWKTLCKASKLMGLLKRRLTTDISSV